MPLETGYLESKNAIKLEKFISDIEESNKPKYDKDGNMVTQGFFPNAYDHFLDSYSEMLEHLRNHKVSSNLVQ